jgi:hypothetical protein
MKIKIICLLQLVLLSLIKISRCLELNYINLNELNDFKIPKNLEKTSEFSEVLNTSNILEKSIKRTACLALVRNLISSKDSRILVSKENLSENLENDFDMKIVLKYVQNCEGKISVQEASEILTPQNILSTDEKFVTNVLVINDKEYILSQEEEREILKQLSLNTNKNDDEEVKLETSNKTTMIIFSVVAFILLVLIIKNLRKKEPEYSIKKKNK